MPGQNPQIFDSTNNNYVQNFNQAGAGRGTYVGMCGGLSSLWLKNMVSGVRDLLSKPDEGRAQILQVKYRWDKSLGGQDAINLLASAGVTGVLLTDFTPVSIALETIATTGGSFLIWNGPHFVAAQVAGGKFYFYDCEHGLYLYNTKLDWKAQIQALGYGTTYPDDWKVWSVT
jgi:hypothetical protein